MIFEEALEKYIPLGQQILDWMNEHPETSKNEKKTSEYIIDILKQNDYKVTSPRARVRYSFSATRQTEAKSEKPKIAVICEYDAMEEIGHACGHSASCAASILCALALEEAYPDFPFQIDIVGTPDEEIGGGKINMMAHGAFDDYQFAIVAQMNSENETYFKTLASCDLIVNFYGKEAHATSNPLEGISAINGLQLFFHALDMRRVNLPQGDQIQSIICDGGKIPNVIPQKATAYIYLRSNTIKRLLELKKEVGDCAVHCGAAVKNEVDFLQVNPEFAEIFVGEKEQKVIMDVMTELGMECSGDNISRGSSDVGNLDVILPVFNPMVSIEAGNTALYTREFAEALKTESGTIGMKNGAKVMANIIIKLAFEPETLAEIQKEHLEHRR